ncbi:hypothetical protein K493DRAFT_316718, partial [Basidiobolus meristosporus CBS 931.73]
MLFQKCNNSTFGGTKKSTNSTAPQFPCISSAPIFPHLVKSFNRCREASQAKNGAVPQCAIAPMLSRLWRNLFPNGIVCKQRLYAEPYNAVNKSSYLHNVAESAGLAALGHNPLGISAQRLYQINSASTHISSHYPSSEQSEYEYFSYNRDNPDGSWEDFQLYDSDSDSDSGSEASLMSPMFAPLSEIHQAHQIHEEKWEKHNRMPSNPTADTEQSNRRGFLNS